MSDKCQVWKFYRNKWVYLNGKKIKLRKYIYVSAAIMRRKRKKGWDKINHVQNYKNALNKYGLSGLKIYEDLFYKDIPEPKNRSVSVRLGLFLAPLYCKLLLIKENIVNRFKNGK